VSPTTSGATISCAADPCKSIATNSKRTTMTDSLVKDASAGPLPTPAPDRGVMA
jgi:hypothetical protein